MANPERQRIIAALVAADKAGETGKPFVVGEDNLARLRLYAELADSGHVKAPKGLGVNGLPDAVSVMDLTPAGREHLGRLRKEERAESPSGRAVSLLRYAAIYLAGVATPVLTEWLSRLLGGFLSPGG